MSSWRGNTFILQNVPFSTNNIPLLVFLKPTLSYVSVAMLAFDQYFAFMVYILSILLLLSYVFIFNVNFLQEAFSWARPSYLNIPEK